MNKSLLASSGLVAGSCILLALSILLQFVWPLVSLMGIFGFIFTFLNLIGLVLFWLWRKRKNSKLRLSLKFSLLVWFISIFIFLMDALFGGIASYDELNASSINNKDYHLVSSTGCSIECFSSIELYRCEVGNLICLRFGKSITTYSGIPFAFNPKNVTLLVDGKTGNLNLIENDKIVYTFS